MLGDLPERARPDRGEVNTTPPITKRWIEVKADFVPPATLYSNPVRVEVYLLEYDYTYTPTSTQGRRLRKTTETMFVFNYDPALDGSAGAAGMIELIQGEWCITWAGCP